MRRTLTVLVLLCLMAGFGVGVNRWIASHQHLGSDFNPAVSSTTPQFTLPGVVYISQGGEINSISGTTITALPLPASGSWVQPHVLPDASLLVVRRFASYSDLYHVSAAGRVLQQLTNNGVSSSDAIQLNHWIFWPTTSADGKALYFSTDSPKPEPGVSYEVDFAVWSAPMGPELSIDDNGVSPGTQWSNPVYYTGGDIQPVPLADGDVLYASYTITGGEVYSVIGLQTGANNKMIPLTSPAEDCSAPAVAPYGTTVAMICTSNKQTVSLETAQINGTTLSAPTVLLANCLCNSPSWAPTGGGLLYMNATDEVTGNFGLWYIANANSALHRAPREVTQPSVNLDATSAAAWWLPPESAARP